MRSDKKDYNTNLKINSHFVPNKLPAVDQKSRHFNNFVDVNQSQSFIKFEKP